MMTGSCPICGVEIKSDRVIGDSVVCSCGWCETIHAEKADQKQQKRTIMTFAALAMVATMAYGHIVSWGTYSAEAPFLKVGSMLGTLSPDGYEELIKAAIATNKWGTAEQAHIDLYRKTANPEVIARLGKLQMLLKKPQQAVASYELYYKIGGKNPDVAFFYGEVLEQAGQPDKALDAYHLSITQNPEKLNVNATSNLVHILMKEQKYAEARESLEAFYGSAENAKGYLNFEMSELEKFLGTSKTKAKVAGR